MHIQASLVLKLLPWTLPLGPTVFVCAVMPVCANGLGISLGFTTFQLHKNK